MAKGMGFALGGFTKGMRQGEEDVRRQGQFDQQQKLGDLQTKKARFGLKRAQERAPVQDKLDNLNLEKGQFNLDRGRTKAGRQDKEYQRAQEAREYQEQFDNAMRAYVSTRGQNYQPLVDLYNTRVNDGYQIEVERTPDGAFSMTAIGLDGQKKPVSEKPMSFEEFGQAAMQMQDPERALQPSEQVKLSEGQAVFQDGKMQYKNPKAGGGGIGPRGLKDSDLRAQYRLDVEKLIPNDQSGIAMKAKLDAYKRKYGEEQGLERWAQDIDDMPSYQDWVIQNHGVDPYTGQRVGKAGRGLPGRGGAEQGAQDQGIRLPPGYDAPEQVLAEAKAALPKIKSPEKRQQMFDRLREMGFADKHLRSLREEASGLGERDLNNLNSFPAQ